MTRGSKRRANRLYAVLAGIAVLTLVLWQGASAITLAIPSTSKTSNNLQNSTDTSKAKGNGSSEGAQSAPSTRAAGPDDDSEGHETEDPEAPDHGSSTVAQVFLADGDLLTVGHTNSQTEDDGESSGDVTILALGGNELLGAHSNSREGPEEDSSDLLGIGLCDATGGILCVLYAQTSASEDGNETSAEAHHALVWLCLAGSEGAAHPTDGACDAPVFASVGEGHSSTETDKGSGHTTSSARTSLADVCLGGVDQDTGRCSGLGVVVTDSQADADAPSQNDPGSSGRGSFIAVEAGGDAIIEIADPTDVTLPPGCPESGSLLCLFLNQGEDSAFPGGAQAGQDALHLDVVKGAGTTVVLGHVAGADALATNSPLAAPVPPRPGPGPGPLPVTGFEPMLALALGGSFLLVGAYLLALERRRALAIA
ncbi:MAG: hypothetical protein ACRDH6_03995 [Actinomycetota bacterium]